MNLSLAFIIASIVVFILVALGVDLAGLTPEQLTAVGLGFFAAGHLPV